MKYNVFQNNELLEVLNKKNDWKLYNLLKVFEDDTKNATKIKKEDYLTYGKYPIIDQGQSTIAGYTNDVDGIYNNYPAIIFGDHTRIIKYVEHEFFIGADGVKLLKPILAQGELNVKYAYYFLRTVELPSDGYSRHFKYLKEVVIPLPKIKIQNKIVEVLDKAKELIDKRKAQIEDLDELVKSKFIEMFGDPVLNPKGWHVKLLKDVMILANNGLARRGNDVDGDIVLRLVELQNGYIDYGSPNRIKLTEKEMERYLLKDGDFLFARVNGNPDNVGRCAYFEDIGENVYHNDHIIRVRFDGNKVNNSFVSSMLNSPYGKLQMKDKLKTSAGQYTINQTGISEIKIIVPPIELQNQFADFVKQVDKLKFEMEQSLKELEDNFNSLMQRAFKGELFQ